MQKCGGAHIGRLAVMFIFVGLFASLFSLWFVAMAVLGFLVFTRNFFLGGAAILASPTADTSVTFHDEGVDIMLDSDAKRFTWADLAEVKSIKRHHVLWFYDGSVVPIPQEMLSEQTLTEVREKTT